MGPPQLMNRQQFSPDGHTICTVDDRGKAYFFRAPSLEEINALEAEQRKKESEK